MKIRTATREEERFAAERVKGPGRPRRWDFSRMYVGCCAEFDSSEILTGPQSLRFHAAEHGWMVRPIRPDCWVRLK